LSEQVFRAERGWRWGSNASQKAVAYAECMRAHGVPNFPDPGSSNSDTGVDMGSAAYQHARQACAKLSPLGTISTHATEEEITQALESAGCLRDHGYPNLPDPIVTSTTATPPSGLPSSGSGTAGSTFYGNGILFRVPSSIDTSSLVFQAAAKVCNSPLYIPGGNSG
jgi:hypothetical protein